MSDTNRRTLVDASGFAFQLAVKNIVRASGANFEVKATDCKRSRGRDRAIPVQFQLIRETLRIVVGVFAEELEQATKDCRAPSRRWLDLPTIPGP
jgi:hypothetical protein